MKFFQISNKKGTLREVFPRFPLLVLNHSPIITDFNYHSILFPKKTVINGDLLYLKNLISVDHLKKSSIVKLTQRVPMIQKVKTGCIFSSTVHLHNEGAILSLFYSRWS